MYVFLFARSAPCAVGKRIDGHLQRGHLFGGEPAAGKIHPLVRDLDKASSSVFWIRVLILIGLVYFLAIKP